MSEASSDEDDYVYVGTALQHELASTYYASKAAAAPGNTVALPVHQQQVRDAEGRQRFHGAFTGGYSAGFFNTVGSLDGFQPATFKSSQAERAKGRTQQISDFLDEDELEEYQKKSLQKTRQFDTFGDQEHEQEEAHARAEAERRHGTEGSALSVGATSLLRSVPNAIGIELLQKMGWRMGHGIGYREADNLSQMGFKVSPQPRRQTVHSNRAWGPLANLSSDNAPVFMLDVKTDIHGLGYDPYSNAREIREMRKRARGASAENQHAGQRKRRGLAFEASVLEEDDVYGGTLADYADDDDPRAGYNREIVSDHDSDDDLHARLRGPARIEAHREATQHIKAQQGTMGNDSFIEGFVTAGMEVRATQHAQPSLPPGYQAERHKPRQPCAKWYGAVRLGGVSLGPFSGPVQPADPPSDPELKARIDIMAATIARGGSAIQRLAEQTYRDNNDYEFLSGGRGASYFLYRLTSITAALTRAGARPASSPQIQPESSTTQPPSTSLSVVQRAALLNEAPLPGTTAASKHRARSDHRASSETVTRLAEVSGAQATSSEAGPAQATPAADSQPAAAPSLLTSRFVKAGALAPDKGGWTDAAAEAKAKAAATQNAAPTKAMRTVREWRPEPLLCRRFNVPNPFEGRAAKFQPAPEQARLLALPESQRGDAYAAALPGFMRAPAHPAQPANWMGGEPTTLPAPPPRRQDAPSAELPLPPPPPRPAGQRPPEQPTRPAADAASAAAPTAQPDLAAVDDFLATLDGEVNAATPEAGPSHANDNLGDAPSLDADTGMPSPELPFMRPQDITNAIFADTSDDEEDDDGNGDVDEEGGTGQPSDAAGGAPAPARVHDSDASKQVAADNDVEPLAGGGHTDMASALYRAQEKMAAQVAAARARAAAAAAAGPSARTETTASAAAAATAVDENGAPAGASGDKSARAERNHAGQSDSEGEERRLRREHRLRGSRSASPDSGSESSGASQRRRRKKRKKEKRHKASREELVRDALNTLRQDVTAQGMSTEEILELTKALKKSKEKRRRHKHKKHKKKRRREAEPSSSSGD